MREEEKTNPQSVYECEESIMHAQSFADIINIVQQNMEYHDLQGIGSIAGTAEVQGRKLYSRKRQSLLSNPRENREAELARLDEEYRNFTGLLTGLR